MGAEGTTRTSRNSSLKTTVLVIYRHPLAGQPAPLRRCRTRFSPLRHFTLFISLRESLLSPIPQSTYTGSWVVAKMFLDLAKTPKYAMVNSLIGIVLGIRVAHRNSTGIPRPPRGLLYDRCLSRDSREFSRKAHFWSEMLSGCRSKRFLGTKTQDDHSNVTNVIG